MADEIKITELPIKRSYGDTQLYSSKVIFAQQLDSNASQQNSSPLNDATEMVRIENTGVDTLIRVRDAGSFTISASNSVFLGSGKLIEIQVNKAQGQIVSSQNA